MTHIKPITRFQKCLDSLWAPVRELEEKEYELTEEFHMKCVRGGEELHKRDGSLVFYVRPEGSDGPVRRINLY